VARQPRTAKGERVYVVGDVHGRDDLLRKLLIRIEDDNLRRRPLRPRLVFVGDLIDRGPGSAEVISVLRSAQRASKRLVVLMGNHEAALLKSIDGDGKAQGIWLRYGGLATAQSFGVSPPGAEETALSFARRLKKAIPADLIDWLAELPLHHRSGCYFFCHAGVRPGVRLSRQKPQDLLWIRDEFLESDADHGAVIVHGHSICGDEVEFRDNRINVDTGAHQSGILSAVGLEDADQWVVSTAG
jgi:serine/threonine protein phosphatase 1